MVEIKLDDVFDLIVSQMEKVEYEPISPRMKKMAVLGAIEKAIGEENYNQYETMISLSIEFIIQISKGKKIMINEKICCNSIFKCKKY